MEENSSPLPIILSSLVDLTAGAAASSSLHRRIRRDGVIQFGSFRRSDGHRSSDFQPQLRRFRRLRYSASAGLRGCVCLSGPSSLLAFVSGSSGFGAEQVVSRGRRRCSFGLAPRAVPALFCLVALRLSSLKWIGLLEMSNAFGVRRFRVRCWWTVPWIRTSSTEFSNAEFDRFFGISTATMEFAHLRLVGLENFCMVRGFQVSIL